MEQRQKPLKDLNLLDRFLFAQAADDPDTMRDILEIILGKEVVLKLLPQTEKEQRTHPLNRYVRLDVWAMDEQDTVYNTEVQQKNTGNLPKRSRFYQALIDSNLLTPGNVGFHKLNPVYIILICPFDLFGYGLYRYTFRMQCEEVPELSLGDNAVRIFLNTHGKNAEGVSEELVDLLKYMEHTTEEVSRTCASERIHKIQKRIRAIKSSEKIGVKYMQAWEEKIIERNEAREEGIREGHASGLKEGLAQGGLQKLEELVKKKVQKGYSAEEIAEMLETDIETVQKFIKNKI
ncbi:Rpn family recombination-promoting nuclease/putative transposase [Faecalicatena acetigenes]|uniref:Rpn family recombination-promoting nuclease/putative transposase n=1 Tax=Faecalicatena acetigenes TaxID=2981790 RepID=A0ABT2TFT8_9FIRM|nr:MULTISPECIES: Rpn family recombination-promoting nuclease/putative transposase [Lachnospiraceae]MCU6748662.1 Rpn family recombination-promoting nuclease/putative transposase [Faecalicatena acetigenes]SCI57415.1 PD-(D/E)XK nuclease family transposase [uncultured Clostridium sp.]